VQPEKHHRYRRPKRQKLRKGQQANRRRRPRARNLNPEDRQVCSLRWHHRYRRPERQKLRKALEDLTETGNVKAHEAEAALVE
jgi:hypothetical protein